MKTYTAGLVPAHGSGIRWQWLAPPVKASSYDTASELLDQMIGLLDQDGYGVVFEPSPAGYWVHVKEPVAGRGFSLIAVRERGWLPSSPRE